MVNVPVMMQVTEESGITLSGIDLAIEYDPSQLLFSGWQLPATLLAEDFSQLAFEPEVGHLLFTASSETGTDLLGNASLMELVTFRSPSVPTAATGPTSINLLTRLPEYDHGLVRQRIERPDLVSRPGQ